LEYRLQAGFYDWRHKNPPEGGTPNKKARTMRRATRRQVKDLSLTAEKKSMARWLIEVPSSKAQTGFEINAKF